MDEHRRLRPLLIFAVSASEGSRADNDNIGGDGDILRVRRPVRCLSVDGRPVHILRDASARPLKLPIKPVDAVRKRTKEAGV